MLRSLRGVLLIVVILLLALAGVYAWMRTSLPATQGDLVLSGLSARVDVVRDSDGIPHISASSREDAYFALGFVHAQDRLWQMEERRLVVAGRLAEVLGERAVGSDRLMRMLGLYRAAERDLEALSARTRGIVQAYSDGINGYLERRSGALPPEFLLLGHRPEPWRPADVLALLKLHAWQQAGDWQDEMLRAVLDRSSARAPARTGTRSPPDATPGLERLPLVPLLRLMADAPFAGTTSEETSLAWMVGAGDAAEQAPLLALERRGPQLAPSPWYLMHLRTPSFDAAGASLPGIPGLFSGMNGSIAWALVESGHDSQDLFVERIRGNRYLGAEGWRPLEQRTETIAVRGGDDLTLTVRVTERGPLLSDLVLDDPDRDSDAATIHGTADDAVDESIGTSPAADDPTDAPVASSLGVEAAGEPTESFALSLSWTALQEPDRGLQGLLALASARTWDEFRSATDNLHEPSRLALYADAEGEIGIRTVGRLPVREGFDGRLPAAPTGARWDGTRSFGELPEIRNPRSGRIVAAGGEGRGFSTWPLRSDSAAAGRLHRLLGDLRFHSSESFERLLADEYLPSTARLLPLAREAVPTSEGARSAQAELIGWDGSMSSGSPAPLLFRTWLVALLRLAFEDELGPQVTALLVERPLLGAEQIEERPRWCDDLRTSATEDCHLLAARALDEAVSDLEGRLGEDPAKWTSEALGSEVHRHAVLGETWFGGIHDVRLERGRGSLGPIRQRSDPRATTGGPVLRAVYDLAGMGRSGQVIATGQSGNSLDRHYRRFGRAWSSLDLVPLRREELQEEGVRVLVLEPRR